MFDRAGETRPHADDAVGYFKYAIDYDDDGRRDLVRFHHWSFLTVTYGTAPVTADRSLS